jgi:hypothetical protein
MPVNQFRSISLTDLGVVNLVAIWTTLQICLACWQLKKRCLIVSLQSQKQHFWLPTQFLLVKLSFVKMTPRCRYQRKIFIFRGIFGFHMNLLLNGTPSFIIYSYIDRTEQKRFLFCWKQERIRFARLNSWTSSKQTNVLHTCHKSQTRSLEKANFCLMRT